MRTPKFQAKLAEILHELVEEGSSNILITIATRKQIRTKTLRSLNNLTAKQYYSRLQRLMRLGLIKRKSGVFTITSFGEVIYDGKKKIDSAIDQYWQLKAVDSVKASNEINEDIRMKMVDNIVTDNSIKLILLNARGVY
jgi:predicted transcriptional regulator